MKKLLILTVLLPLITRAQSIKDFNYPMSDNKIQLDSSIKASGTKDILFKRVQEFFAVHYFDKQITVKAKSDNITSLKIIDKPILYQDAEIGKVIGHGWLPLNWGKYKYTFVVFKIEANVSDGGLKYSFSDFRAIDILDAPKSRSAALGGVLFSASASSSSPTISKEYPLEEYMTENRFPSKWLIKNDNYGQTFKNELLELQMDFINTVNGN